MSTATNPTRPEVLAPSTSRRKSGKLTLWPLVAATFFMVSGGTYGTEDIVHGAGYLRGILILLLTPRDLEFADGVHDRRTLVAIPAEGGYYAWVRRAMGNMWGFQEAWLSLVASIFDMAIYPTLFVAYLTRLVPWFAVGHRGVMVGLAVVIVCALLNIAGVQGGGDDLAVVVRASLGAVCADRAARAVQVRSARQRFHHACNFARRHHGRPADRDVELHGLGQCLHHRAGSRASAEDISSRDDRGGDCCGAQLHPAGGSDVDDRHSSQPVGDRFVGRPGWIVGGPLLRVALVLGGMMSAFGMFNSLVMSYSRLPLAMAQDGMLPKVFGKVHSKTRVPWVSILVLATGWALCLGLGFERLVTIDVLIYGCSLLLEFMALVFLRIREPNLPRTFRVPGGLFGAVMVGVVPMAMLGYSVYSGDHEQILGMSAFTFGVIVIGAGFVFYATTRWFADDQRSQADSAMVEAERLA